MIKLCEARRDDLWCVLVDGHESDHKTQEGDGWRRNDPPTHPPAPVDPTRIRTRSEAARAVFGDT